MKNLLYAASGIGLNEATDMLINQPNDELVKLVLQGIITLVTLIKILVDKRNSKRQQNDQNNKI